MRRGVSMRKDITFPPAPSGEGPPVVTGYRLAPFLTDEFLYSIADFQELLKKYACGSDNGTGYWANSEGRWIEMATGEPIQMDPNEIRAGRRPEPFFTHIEYLPK
jgi:hypothetical protein